MEVGVINISEEWSEGMDMGMHALAFLQRSRMAFGRVWNYMRSGAVSLLEYVHRLEGIKGR
jgi:hypothetical protein